MSDETVRAAADAMQWVDLLLACAGDNIVVFKEA